MTADLLPKVDGRWVTLRSMSAGDYDFIYPMVTSPTTGYRWRFRGNTPNPEVFQRVMWENVLAQHVVIAKDTGRPIGFVNAYNPDFVARHTSVGIVLDPNMHHTGWGLEALVLFIDFVFETFGFRKLYTEVPEYNESQFLGAWNSLLDREAVLKDHIFLGGRYWSLIISAIYPDTWSAWKERIQKNAARLHAVAG